MDNCVHHGGTETRRKTQFKIDNRGHGGGGVRRDGRLRAAFRAPVWRSTRRCPPAGGLLRLNAKRAANTGNDPRRGPERWRKARVQIKTRGHGGGGDGGDGRPRAAFHGLGGTPSCFEWVREPRAEAHLLISFGGPRAHGDSFSFPTMRGQKLSFKANSTIRGSLTCPIPMTPLVELGAPKMGVLATL